MFFNRLLGGDDAAADVDDLARAGVGDDDGVGAAAVADGERGRLGGRVEQAGALPGQLADVDRVAGGRAGGRRVERDQPAAEPVRRRLVADRGGGLGRGSGGQSSGGDGGGGRPPAPQGGQAGGLRRGRPAPPGVPRGGGGGRGANRRDGG